MMDVLELLTYRMKERTPVLLLGAGFSIGATNYEGTPLPKGDQLVDSLYKHFYEDNLPDTYGPAEIETLSAIKKNLKELCYTISSEGRKTERDLFIRNTFRGSTPNLFHHKLTGYRWRRIYSLNVDDLVENVYRQQNFPLNIWNRSNHGRLTNFDAPTLIKLHGCVNDIASGVVFDTEEYQTFTAEQDCLLKEFSHDFLRNDAILLGTEFQEDDLKIALKIYEKSGYDNSGYHYFFVSPSIGNLATRNQLLQAEEKSSNFHWIRMTTEAFLTHIVESITEPLTMRNQLKEKGVIFIDELFDARTPGYKSSIYSGAQSQYQDFFDDWDIEYPGLIKQCERIHQNRKNMLIALVGRSYVGKSCAAKRALIYYMRQSYLTIEIMRLDVPLLVELMKYLEGLPQETQIAIYIDSASYQYLLIKRLFERCPSNIGHLVVINADTYDNHRSKLVVFQRTPFLKTVFVDEKIDDYYSKSIFRKLYDKRRLNEFLTLIPPRTEPSNYKYRKVILDKMLEINDFIEVLYFSSEGRDFNEYYSTVLESYKHQLYDQYLAGFCALAKLGIAWVPNELIPYMFPLASSRFIYNDFVKQYPDLIQTVGGRTKILRRRLIQPLFEITDDVLLDFVYNFAIQLCDMFTEGVYNEYYELFQKLLRVKKIHKVFHLSFESLYLLMQSLESSCNHSSYFWIQYGITAQQLFDFENANNHLLYAKSIRSNSYSVKHALAKNNMERGIFESNTDEETSHTYFEKGKHELIELIESREYTDAYLYSVHALVDLLLKRASKLNFDLTDEEYRYVHNHLTKIRHRELDTRLQSLIKQFISHSDLHGHRQLVNDLRNKTASTAAYVMTEDDYDGDQVDLSR